MIRVMWKDAAGDGRFTDVADAKTLAAAAWAVAIASDSRAAEFVDALYMGGADEPVDS